MDGGNIEEDNKLSYTVEDENFTLNEPQKRGYDFMGWYTTTAYTDKVTEVYTIQCKNISLYAYWKKHDYIITYTNGYKHDNPVTCTMDDEKIILEDATRTGYEFEGWYSNEGCTEQITSIDPSACADITVYAKWKLLTYSITYYLDDGTNSENNKESYTVEDEIIVLQNPTKKGYDFVGWYTALDYSCKVTSVDTSKEKDVELYARWNKHTYSIEYVDGGTHENVSQYIITDDDIVLTDAQKKGYIFDGWYTDSKYRNKVDSVSCDSCEDIVLYAKWIPIVYSVSYELNGGLLLEEENPSSYTADQTELVLNTPVKENYDFVGWYLEEDDSIMYEKIPVEECRDIKLCASWIQHPYTINYVDGNTHTNPLTYVINDEILELGEASQSGHTFLGWYADQEYTERITSIDQSQGGDITVYAKWQEEVPVYKIKQDSKELGSIIYDNDNYFYMTFPVNGKLICSNTNSSLDYVYFSFDTENYAEQVENVSDFSGAVSNGTHFIKLLNIGPNNFTTTVSYTFYPECKIYYIDGEKNGILETYYLQTRYSRLKLPNKNFKGYNLEGWYLDKEFEYEITTVDKSIGKDWYVYPKKSPIVYNINYELDGGVNPEDAKTTYTIEDNNFDLPIPMKKGYDFAGWYTTPLLKTSITEIDTQECEDVTVYAKWTKHEYTITYTDGYTHSNIETYTIEDAEIILSDATRTGYTFKGWYSNKAYTEQITSIDTSVCEDVILYARWNPIVYSITYELNGGANPEDVKITYIIEDNSVTLPIPTKKGYDFKGWYTTSSFETEITKIDTQQCEDVTVYAKWVKHNYVITYRDGFTHSNKSKYTIEDDEIILSDATRAGYTFEGWYMDEGCTEQITNIDPSACKDITMYAKWSTIEYSVTYELDGGLLIEENPSSYTADQTELVLNAPQKEHYDFAGWYLEDDPSTMYEKIPVEECRDIKLCASWTQHPYTIEYVDGNTHTNPLTYVIKDEILELSKPRQSGYSFLGWYADQDYTEKITGIDQSSGGDITIYAKWRKEEITYNIATGSKYLTMRGDDKMYVNFENAGWIEFNSDPWYAQYQFDEVFTSYAKGDTIDTFSGRISSGSHYVWLVDRVFSYDSSTASYTFYPECNVYYIDGENEGTLTSYYLQNEPEDLTLPEITLKGYEFDGWYVDKEWKEEITTVDKSIGKDWYVYPKKTPIVYAINYELDGGANPEEAQTTYTIEDGSVTLPVPTKKGYDFTGWYTTPLLETKVTSIDTSVCKDVRLYAGWKKKEVTNQENGTVEVPDSNIKPSEGNESFELPKLNDEIQDLNSNALYRVTKAGETGGTVEYVQSLVENLKKITIPDEIEVNGILYEVTSISNNAFANCQKLKSVKLGENIKTIGSKAFYKCTRLTKITIPLKVTNIKKQAFYGCKKLKNITIKTTTLTAKKVGAKAFSGIHSKAVIKVPKKKLALYAKIMKSKGIVSTAKVK